MGKRGKNMLIRFSKWFVILAFVGCDTPPLLSEAEVAAELKGAPQIIIGGEKPTLEGLEAFYLGQPEADAMQKINAWCGNPTVYEGGYRRENAVFRGCATPEHPMLHSFRVGFHPKLDNAVFTLEVKRRSISLPTIRARFYEALGTPFEDLPRSGIVRMRSERYNLFASSDDGKDRPVHIVFGTNPDTF